MSKRPEELLEDLVSLLTGQGVVIENVNLNTDQLEAKIDALTAKVEANTALLQSIRENEFFYTKAYTEATHLDLQEMNSRLACMKIDLESGNAINNDIRDHMVAVKENTEKEELP